MADQHAKAGIAYRPEIDGLRAFAVLAVIINHFNKHLLPSGYLGVDIFFVISGYVITASLAGRRSKNFADFLGGFYERRFKRLLPALLIFVLITGFLVCLFNPSPQISLNTGLSSLVGFSNLYLLSQSTDYFAQSTELNPFTHTWSLGVEEQFYLLLPFVIWFSGYGRQTIHGARWLALWVGLLTVASLAGFLYLYPRNQAAAYFLMPTRFWEMAAGCLVWLGFQKRQQIELLLERVPPFLVVVLMAGAMVLPLSAAVPATIAIVVLTAILLACLKQGTGAYRMFTLRPVVAMGLISYSLYLWHWGVLSISRWSIGVSWWSTPLQLALTLALATVSYRLIEQPLRRSSLLGRWATFGSGLFALGVASAGLFLLSIPAVHSRIAIVGEADGVFQRGRQSQSNYVGPVTGRKNKKCGALSTDLSPSLIRDSMKECLWEGSSKDASRPIVAFLGDSHAHQLFPIAELIAKEFNLPVYNFYYLNCMVPQDGARLDSEDCSKVNQVPEWFHEAVGERPVIYVIASISDPIINFPSEAGQRRRVEAFREAFSPLLSKGNRLIVVAPNPKFLDIDNSISDTCRPTAWSRLNPICSKDYTFAAQEQSQRRKVYLQSLRDWAKADPRVFVVDPFWVLCDEKDGLCHSRKNGVSKYWDRSHLNEDAVVSTYPLYRQILKTITQQLAGSGASPVPPL